MSESAKSGFISPLEDDGRIWIQTFIKPNQTTPEQLASLSESGAHISYDGDNKHWVVLIPTTRSAGSGNPFLDPPKSK
ncbi:hypothetical protein HY948_01935 [Candidatus Gottesmanbacteria bacterium]|nr:hypothetical protein [Candidatus Gottesmanbacteria bacterium]